MTALNAEKYLRSLPNGTERAGVLSLPGLVETKKRTAVVTCVGLHADMMVSMLVSVLADAGISAAMLRLGEPYSAGRAKDLLLNGKSLPPDMLVSLTTAIKKTARERNIEAKLGRYEAMSALALMACREGGARILVIDASALSGKELSLLPAADQVLLAALPSDSREKLGRLIMRGASEAVTVPQLPSVYSAITGRCAESGCRLTASARPGLPGGPCENAESFLRSSFSYRGTDAECRAHFRSSVCRAAAVIDCVNALRRAGMNISDSAVVRGLGTADGGYHGSVVAVQPSVISAELPTGTEELNIFFSELLSDMSASRLLDGIETTVFLACADDDVVKTATEHFEAANSDLAVHLAVAATTDISKLAAELSAMAKSTEGGCVILAARRDTLRALLPELGRHLINTMI